MTKEATNGSTVDESLECGTSLAEREHQFFGTESQVQRSSQTFNGAIKSIPELRSALASDVLTSGDSIEMFSSPFEVPSSKKTKDGDKFLTVPLVYCDQTASNRAVKSIEQYMEKTCLPLYGNTHTNTSITGSQSTAFVAEARQIVAEATNAKITGKASLDVVLFAGNGSTSAVELLIDCLGLKNASMDNENRPVVFIGPYEHHSNLLPWRGSGCEIVMIPECPKAHSVDLVALERSLTKPEYENRLKMGTFSAASNVNGKISDVDAISATLHRHSALAFFDYATAAPYMPMNMNPPPSEAYPSSSLIAKDAVFLSPHKMLGGIGTPGVLIVKKNLVSQMNVPSKSGGGTVFYVTSTHHRFLSNRIERYEGGTPNVSGIMRTGLTFLLKRKAEEQYSLLRERNDTDTSLPQTLLGYDCDTYRRVLKDLRQRAPNLVMLGEKSNREHLPVFSLLIRCGNRFLHYNFVCALLNDIFGIQSRGGCQCSGPYSQRLLGLTRITPDGNEVPNDRNERIEYALVNYKERAEVLRPGYTRLSLPFKGVRDEEVDYVVNALVWIAQNGWLFMCQYRCNHRTGEWRHASRQGKPLGRTERKWLSHYDAFRGESDVPAPEAANSNVQDVLQEAFANANALLEDARVDRPSIAQALKMANTSVSAGSEDDLIEELRWFVHPKECAIWLTEGLSIPPETDSEDVLGALHPNQCSEDPVGALVTDSILPAPAETSETRKRKMSDVTGDVAAATVADEAEAFTRVPSNSDYMQSAGKSLVRQFRDGEHVGEAPLDDIVAGYDEGELSDRCEVYDSQADAWVPIEMLASRETNGRVVNHADQENPTESSESCAQQVPHIKLSVPFTPESLALPASGDTVKQLKKQQRDSASWGVSTSCVPRHRAPGQSTAAAETTNRDTSNSGPTAIVTSALLPDDTSVTTKRWRHVKPPPKLMRYMTQAMMQWNMIEEGDRLLLGLSGGKDSLSLLHCLLEFQKKLPINFEIEICTIDPMTPSFDPSPLIPYVEELGLKYHYIRDDIVSRANTSGKYGKIVSSLCAFCARMKRGNLYTCARRNKCNKLVLAQHLDDCAESFLMSMMHNGFLRTMKAHYQINAGDISVIRPMAYCRESLMTEFAKSANLPVINENCPACFEEPKERARVKKLLAREETLYPNLYDNIRRSLIPLMHDDSTAIMRCYLEEALAKSKKVPKGAKGKPPRQDQRGSTIDDQDAAEEKKGESDTSEDPKLDSTSDTTHDAKRIKLVLAEASDEDLVKELARRKAEKFRLSGAMKRLDDDGPPDPTGLVCTVNGDGGSIPCRELME